MNFVHVSVCLFAYMCWTIIVGGRASALHSSYNNRFLSPLFCALRPLRSISTCCNNVYLPAGYRTPYSLSRKSHMTTMSAKGDISSSPLSIPRNTAIVLAGCTSVGKSSVAMELCKRLDAEIIIADSVQVYKHLDIGSNKPTKEDTDIVRHHLIDISTPSVTVTTGDFTRLAANAVTDILSRGKVPIIVGGSTMWVQWLVHGIPDAPKGSERITAQANDLIKVAEEQKDWSAALHILSQYDHKRASELCNNDWYRLRRSLEIALSRMETAEGSSGSSSSSSVQQSPLTGTRKKIIDENSVDFRTFFLSEDRSELYHTIDARCVDMLRLGLLEEVTQLVIDGILSPNYPVSKSIGYRQSIEYLSKISSQNMTQQQLREEFLLFLSNFCTATRNYAKRQLNWYRKDKRFLFLEMKRKDVNKHLAYNSVVDEIVHWTSIPHEEFLATVAKQCSLAASIAEMRSCKSIHSISPDTPEKVLALKYLLHNNELIGGNKRKIDGSVELNNVALPQWWNNEYDDVLAGNSTHLLTPEWTAEGFEVRCSAENKKNIMKTYTNMVATTTSFQYSDLIDVSLRCKSQLITADKLEVLLSFDDVQLSDHDDK